MTMFWWFLSLHMGHSYTLSHLTCLTQPYGKFSSASHARCRRQKAETKTCCDDDKMVITVDIESCWTFWMALWIVQMIIHDLCYPNKLTDCVFFVEVLFYAFTYMFWGKSWKKYTFWLVKNTSRWSCVSWPGSKNDRDARSCFELLGTSIRQREVFFTKKSR